MPSSPFDWLDFLELAKRLRGSAGAPSPVEADLRTAVSRAYYFAYHSTILKIGYRSAHSGGQQAKHGAFWDGLQNLTIPAWAQDVGTLGSSLMKLRHNSDYKDRIPVTQRDVDLAINQAIEIKKRLRI